MSQAPTLGAPRATPPTRGRSRGQRVPFRTWSIRWPARLARATLWHVAVEPILRALYDVDGRGVERLERVPGPVIFAANHCAHPDNAFILASLPVRWRRRVAIAASVEGIFEPRILGIPIKGIGAQLLGNAFPFIQRRRAARVDHFQSLLDQGWSVLIFPEGKLTVMGPMQPFRQGIGLLATGFRVPVVPVRVEVTRRGVWEGGGLSRGAAEVRFGGPLAFREDEDPAEATARIEAAVRAL